MFSVDDVMAIEQGSDAEAQVKALQRAINDGAPWKFQGSMGRSMMAALEDGSCMLGRKAAFDYWGNRIPSRDEVKEGSKGSRQYVADCYGEEYAEMIEAIE